MNALQLLAPLAPESKRVYHFSVVDLIHAGTYKETVGLVFPTQKTTSSLYAVE